MNAYERHVIHTALQDHPNVTTYSTGTEPNRRTVVAYAPGQKKYETHRRGGNEIPPRLLTPERRPVMPTPLYDALRGYAAKAPLRFHMPATREPFFPAPSWPPWRGWM